MATNNTPANTLRCGNIKATIWQNVSEKGPFFATTDQQGNYHGKLSTNSLIRTRYGRERLFS